jgi:CheY-like chemotaxis protein
MDCDETETMRAENGLVMIDISVDRPADIEFNMVLMDQCMPVMGRLEATSRVHTT